MKGTPDAKEKKKIIFLSGARMNMNNLYFPNI